jgi:hypothetical protein
MWEHGIHFDRLSELLENRYVTVRDRSQRAAEIMLIGRDNSRRCIVVPIVPTTEPGIWRPVTAWFCKRSEVALLRQRRSIMEAAAQYGYSQEPLDDEERELMDPEHWDWDSAVEGIPMMNVGAILPIHFTREEIGPLQRLAHAQGMTAHAFIKQAALDRVSQEAPEGLTTRSSAQRREANTA